MEKIESAKNSLVRRMASLKRRDGREAEGLIFVEGEKMVKEALTAGLSMKYAFFTGDPPPFIAPPGVGAYRVKEHVMKAMADTVTPQSVAAAFIAPPHGALPIDGCPLVAIDGVRDPGNAGTIWRTADAAGYKGILFGAGCAEASSPKVQRAAMGSCFRIPAHEVEIGASLTSLRQCGYRIVASALHGQDVYEMPPCPEKHVLVIGSEARGVSESVLDLADEIVTIPMRGGAESLNAAVSAGILMYLLTK